MNNNLIQSFRIIIILVFTTIFLISTNSFAGAWTQKKGSGYYKVDFRFVSGENIYNPDGEKVPLPKFTDMTIGAFGSYGITDELTGFVGAALFKSVKLDTSAAAVGFDTDVSGFGDIAGGLKYRLLKFKNSVLSAKLIFILPTGKSTPDSSLWIGSNDFSQAIGLDYGYSLYPLPMYFNVGITYSNRTNGFSDHFNYGIEAGYKFTSSLSLNLRFHGQVSMNNGDENIYGGIGIFSNNQQFIAYSAELVYKITDNFGVKGYYESGGAGKNIISAPVLNAGIFFTH